MFFLLRLLQKFVQTLSSEGTPGQVAFGLTLGTAFGITPFVNAHNFLILAFVFVANVSFPAVMLGWIVATPVGFLLDPLFDRLGDLVLTNVPGLVPTWTLFYNMPVVPLSKYNNTVVMGSLISWVVLTVPIFFVARWAVKKYRDRIVKRLDQYRVVKAVKASKLYSVYRWFSPS